MVNFFSPSSRRRTVVTSWLAAIASTVALTACGGGGGSAGSVTPTAITGLVQDASAQPVANAVVQAAGQTATTGSNGRFSFTVTSTTPTTVVLVKKTGFATNAKSAPVLSGNATDITFKLVADQVSTTFPANSGATLAPNGAKVVIPANAIQTAAGAAYTGTVTVGANYYGPDTVAGVEAFPAPYEGNDGSTSSPLITMGVIEVKLTDAAGNPLQLKTGFPATLTYPANSVSAGAANVPLWFYDETTKIWTREGQATKQTDGTYQGAVSHFTLWNADFKGVTATINGCFRDAAGNAVTKAGVVGVRGNGWSHVFSGSTSNGNFTVSRVPAGMPLELYSATQPSAFGTLAVPSLAAGEVRLLACVVVTNPPTGSVVVIPPTSTIFTTSAATYAGNYTGTYSGAEIGTFAVTINSGGQVSGTATSTTYIGLVSVVSGTVGGNGIVSLTATGTAGAATFSGAISGANVLTGTWQYSGASGGGTFTGQRN